MSSPSSQKPDVRPVSFVLDDQANTKTVRTVNLYLRPEDLTRAEPSRINVQQTLGGGAWADNFGPGIPTISISGTTGWRRDASGKDGIERFEDLHDHVFLAWHDSRRIAVNNGLDPGLVDMTFVDGLDNFSASVIPMRFLLRRNKARPLLISYQIEMMVVSPLVKRSPLMPDDKKDLGLESLLGTIGEIKAAADEANDFIDVTIRRPVKAFLDKTALVYRRVHDAIVSIDNIAGSLTAVALNLSRAGTNVFRTLAAVANLPARIKGRLMQVAGAYENAFCLLKNALAGGLVYQDYSDLFGASNCSSTNGGRPISRYADVNPFYLVAPSEASPVLLTNQAQASMKTLANLDPSLAPPTTASLAANVSAVSGGLTLQ